MNITNYLTQLVIPVNFAVVLLLIATLFLLFKKRKPAVIVILTASAWTLFWSLPIASIWLGGHLENRFPYGTAAHTPTADAIVVLGGQTANGRQNWFEQYDPKKITTRIHRGAELYSAQRAPLILVSGAALDGGTSEAQTMARYLINESVPEQDIVIEEESYTTRENAIYSAKKLKAYEAKHVLLVTSALHMARAMATFEKQGVTVIAAPVAPQITRPNDSWHAIWKPNCQTLNASRSIIKEYVGLLIYWLRGWI